MSVTTDGSAAPTGRPRVPRGPTVAVLSPVTGGFYFGGILSGVAREVAAVAGQVVLLQTLDAGRHGDEALGPPDFSTASGWDHVDGVLALAASAKRPYLDRLRAAGKPVVMAGQQVDGFSARSAMPDNEGGVHAAVEHLVVAHGHTRIGFLGSLEQTDMAERFVAYQAALRAHGLEPDPALFYPAGDNAETGGHAAAARMVDDGLPATAVIAATDRNALGLLTGLRASSHPLAPAVAVIGFDDVEPCFSTQPALTTVNQQFDEVGALAARILLDQMRGIQLPAGRQVSSCNLVVRTSCGCTPDARLRLGADRLAEVVEVHLSRAARLESTIAEQYAVSMSLLDRQGVDPRTLQWMSSTHVRLGSLALWEGTPGQSGLRVSGVYDPEGVLAGSASLVGTVVAATEFPSREMVAQPDPRAGEVTFVIPVRARGTDWGVLAVVGWIDARSMDARATYNHWAALLAVAFEQERLLEDVRASEERYAVAARATDDGLWDWDLRRGTTYYSDRCREMLGCDATASGPDVLLSAVHPDDVAQVRAVLSRERLRAGPVEVEHRLRAADGPYRWVQCRAIAISVAGQPAHRLVGSLSDIDDRKVLEEQLRRRALHDAVTGLPNRTHFLDRLRSALATDASSAGSAAEGFTVLFLDVDGFKGVNDSLGHAIGDQLLVAVAEKLRTAIRTQDIAARFGGDEFAVLLHTCDLPAALRVVERIQRAVAEPLLLPTDEVRVTASIGIAVAEPGSTITADDILRDADAAMYRAKAAGRGSWALHGCDLPSRVTVHISR